MKSLLLKPKVYFFFVVLFSLFFQNSYLNAQVLRQTFSESHADFKVSTPNENWHFVPRGIAPGPVRATLRFKSPVYRFVPNATVRVLPLRKGAISLEKFVEQETIQLPKSILLLSKKEIHQNGKKGYEVILEDQKSQLRFWQRIFFAKQKSFVLTCTAKSASFAYVQEDFAQILNSFQIK